jgi:hypothetical protein
VSTNDTDLKRAILQTITLYYRCWCVASKKSKVYLMSSKLNQNFGISKKIIDILRNKLYNELVVIDTTADGKLTQEI